MSWSEFLDGLMSPYLQVAVGVLWFVVWEYLPELGVGKEFFEKLDQNPKLKRMLIAAVTMSVPVGAYLLKVATLGEPFVWDSNGAGLWYAIVAGAAGFSGGTLAHTVKLT